RAIDTATSLSDILDTLATAASRGSSRSGVFLLSGSAVRGFRVSGFPARFDGAPIDLPLTNAGVIADAIGQRALATSSSSPFDELPADIKTLAAPLVLAGAPIGALYAEGADVTTIEILARFASRALEALTAMKTARAVAEGHVV